MSKSLLPAGMVLLVLISMALYGGAGQHTRLATEAELIWRNPAVVGEDPTPAFQGIWQAGEFRDEVRPVPTLLRRVEASLFEYDRAKYQMLQILLHGIVAALLLALFRRWLDQSGLAILGAFLFLAHPALANSVLFLGGLTEILATAIVLLTLLIDRPGLSRTRRLWVFLLAFLAMMTKEIAFVLPLLALGLVPASRSGWRNRIAQAAPYGAAAALAFGYRVIAIGTIAEPVRRIPAVDPTTALPTYPLILQSIAGAAVEAGMAILPIRLSVDHSWLLVLTGPKLFLLAGIAALLTIGVLGFLLRRGGGTIPQAPLLLLAWIPLLVPAVIPRMVGSVASERNLYLALPGVIGLVLLLGREIGRRRPGIRSPLIGVGAGVVLLFGVGTVSRNGDFQNTESLLAAAARAHPDNPQVIFELANQELTQIEPDYGEAIRLYLRALELRPNFPMAEVNLGAAYIGQEEWGLALRMLDTVAQRSKHVHALRMVDAKAHYHAGLVLLHQEREREAALAFERTLLFYPNHLGARGNLGLIYIGAPDYVDRGMAELEYALEREQNPDRREFLMKKLDRARELRQQYIDERGGTPKDLEPPGRGAIGEPWKDVAEEGM